MPSLIISSASPSSPRIFIYHSSHIILIPSSFHSIILAFFTFPLIHFTMVLFAISSKLIFTHFIYHTLLFIIPSSFPSYFTSITLITTLSWFSIPFASMFLFIHFHPFPSHSSSHPLQSHSLLSISISFLSFHYISSFPLISYSSFDSSLSHVQWYPHPSLSTVHSILTHSFSFHRFPSFFILFHLLHPIYLISSLNLLITSLYLLSFFISLDSVLCSIFYDLSFSFSHYSPITPLSFYSLSFLFISWFLIPLFVIALYYSFPFIRIPSRPLDSLLSFYPISLIHSISSSLPILSNTPPSLLHFLTNHPLFIPPSSLLRRLVIALPHHSIPFSSHPILLPSPLQQRPISFLILSLLLRNTLSF